MEEKRKFKRLPASMTLEISSLFKQDHISIDQLAAPIHVTNISKGGIGFTSTNDLPIGFYFNSCIRLGTDEEAKLYCVVKILRKDTLPAGGFDYGCELVGIAPVLSYIFDDYEKSLEA